MKIPSRKKIERISKQFSRAVFSQDLRSRADHLRKHAVQLGLFVSSLPMTYLGTASFQVRLSDHGWMITERGSTIPLRVCVRKNDAVREAKRMAQENHAHLDVFTRQGSLQAHESFS